MNFWEILVAIVVAWALGPTVLQWAGASFALLTVGLLAFEPAGFHADAALVVGGGGALMWLVGTRWRWARVTGHPTALGAKARRTIGRLTLAGNPHGRLRRRLAMRALWRFEHAEIQQVFRDAEDAVGAHSIRAPRWTGRFERLRWERREARPRGRAGGGSLDDSQTEAVEQGAGAGSINGTAREAGDAGPEPAAARQALREEVDRTLEEARAHLDPIIHELFTHTDPDWHRRLDANRWLRRRDLPPLSRGEDTFADRRELFSTIAYDWTLIGHHFLRDPSAAGRKLCEIANRYAHEGPREDDPAAARQAFGQIIAALRPQAIETVKGFLKHYRPLSGSRW